MKVSICCITYNHEKFIAQALDSFLMQKFDDFEIVVGDDASSDETVSILREYKLKYPEKIKLLINQNNIGMMKNFHQVLVACNGKYIALCEGDDYWVDSQKLKKQFAVMESNTALSLCFHKCSVLYESLRFSSSPDPDERKEIYTEGDIIRNNWFIMTCSIFFRRSMLEIPSWFKDIKNGDYALQLLLACKGDVYEINEVMGVYRKHSGGVSYNYLQLELNYKSTVDLLTKFNEHTHGQYQTQITFKDKRLRSGLVEGYAYKLKDTKYNSLEYLKLYGKMLKYSSFQNLLHVKYLVKYLFPFK